MSTNTFFPGMIFLISLTIFLESMARHLTPTEHGFTGRLVHRDSPLSPLYDHTMTDSARIEAAVHRSRSRLNYLYSNALSLKTLDNSVSLSPTVAHEGGEYLINFYIGNPPMRVASFIDTSNGLIWVQCDRESGTRFDSSKSFTYEMEPCGSDLCNSMTGCQTCNSSDKWCKYRVGYDDQSATSGILSSDSFSFDGPDGKLLDVGFLNFGCSDAPLRGGIQSKGSMGLNQTPLSLISQLGIKKFSYCLVPFNLGSTSKMYFGSLPVVSGGQTPLLSVNLDAYYVKALGISVGDYDEFILDRDFELYDVGDGWIVDSATTYTSLETNAFDSLLAKFLRLTDLPQRKKDPKNRFELCFGVSGEDLELFPEVTIHFDGADLVLEMGSTFVKMEEDGVICLAILRSGSPVSILGNFQLQNYYVGYDLEAQVISFAPVDCAESDH